MTARSLDVARLPGDLSQWAGLLVVIGFAGIAIVLVDVIRRIVFVAPVVEEFLKFGLGLLLVLLFGVRSAWARVAVALVPGVLFGVFEHSVSYPAEDVVSETSRILFHSGSAALSMASFNALEPVADVRWRWGATLASTALHMANNLTAVAVALLAAAGGPDLSPGMDVLSLALAGVAHGAAWGATTLRKWLSEAVHRRAGPSAS